MKLQIRDRRVRSRLHIDTLRRVRDGYLSAGSALISGRAGPASLREQVPRTLVDLAVVHLAADRACGRCCPSPSRVLAGQHPGREHRRPAASIAGRPRRRPIDVTSGPATRAFPLTAAGVRHTGFVPAPRRHATAAADGCYEAARAAALSGVPVTNVALSRRPSSLQVLHFAKAAGAGVCRVDKSAGLSIAE